MTEPIKHCPQPDAPELVMRADGYHYKSEDEMKESQTIQAFDKWAREEGINSFHLGHCWDAWQAALALNTADRDVMREITRALGRTHAGYMIGHDKSNAPAGSYSDGFTKGFGECRRLVEELIAASPTPPADRDVGVSSEESLWGEIMRYAEGAEIPTAARLKSWAFKVRRLNVAHAATPALADRDVMQDGFDVELSAEQEARWGSWIGTESMTPWQRSVARLTLLLNTTKRGLIDYSASQHFARELMERTRSAAPTSPAEQQPVEMSPEFTDTARAALLWVLWHHQGANSPVGQPIRFALGMGRDDHLMPHQIAEAKRWDAIKSAEQRGCKGKNCGCTDGVSHSEECLAEHAATIDQAVRPEQQDGQVCARCGGLVSDPVVAQIAEHGSGLRTQPAMKAFVEGCTFAREKVLAALRAKVEALESLAVDDGETIATMIDRGDVLAEIDKLGGGV